MAINNKIWGFNKFGQEVKKGDKIKCSNGFSTWFTHVQFDNETGKWHREEDYFYNKIVGKY